MARQLLTDALWNEIAGFLPTYQPAPRGGRLPIPRRTVLTAILFVLKTGIAWEDLPPEFGCSYKTCLRRLAAWTAAGIWQQIFTHLLTRLRQADRLELTRVLVDAGLVKAPLGGRNRPEPDGARPLRQQVPPHADPLGHPAAVSLTATNEPDLRHLLPLLEEFPRVAGRPLKRPWAAIADKGYDSQPLRQELLRQGILPWLPRRGQPRTYPLGRVRWPVERSLSRLKQFRRLRIRWERSANTHNAFFRWHVLSLCGGSSSCSFCPLALRESWFSTRE